MKIWRHGYIWGIVLVAGILLWSMQATFTTKKEAPGLYELDRSIRPHASIVVEPKTDWVGIGLKISSGLGGIMTLMNLVEKTIKIIRRRS